jgi:hypothetical protein
MSADRFVRLANLNAQRGWGAAAIGRIDSHHPNDPPGKVPWHSGYTGRDGRDPTSDEIAAWPANVVSRLLRGERGVLNLGGRVPVGIIGIDVDQYGPKHGLETIAEHEASLGPLPPTYIITARPYDTGSGIRLFAVSEDWEGPGALGNGVELVQRHHRFVAAPGSLHHTGCRYRLYHQDTGATRLRPVLPPRDGLPAMPDEWLDGLYRKPRQRGAPASAEDVSAFTQEYSYNDCPGALEPTVRSVREATGEGATYPATHRALWIAARKARAGCYPWSTAVDAIRQAASDAYAERGRVLDEYEFGRSMEHAVAQAMDMMESELTAWAARDVSGWGPRVPAVELTAWAARDVSGWGPRVPAVEWGGWK